MRVVVVLLYSTYWVELDGRIDPLRPPSISGILRRPRMHCSGCPLISAGVPFAQSAGALARRLAARNNGCAPVLVRRRVCS